MNITASTALYCIFGSPVSHSLSPVMQNMAFRETGLNAVYLAMEPPSIEAAVNAMRALNIRGASVTIPFKVDALRHIDEIDDLASEIGSVNTLINHDGKISGYNTDGYGALTALRKVHGEISNARVLILGNGGSARAIAFTLVREGAGVTLAGRNLDKLNILASELMINNIKVPTVTLGEISADLVNEYDIIINTTSLGMHPHIDETPLRGDILKSHHTVFDIVYSPDMTRFLKEAASEGCSLVKGIDMLLYQGIRQFELWTGIEAPVSAMRKVLYDAMAEKNKGL